MNQHHYNETDHDHKAMRQYASKLSNTTGIPYSKILYAGQDSYRKEGSVQQACTDMENFCGRQHGTG